MQNIDLSTLERVPKLFLKDPKIWTLVETKNFIKLYNEFSTYLMDDLGFLDDAYYESVSHLTKTFLTCGLDPLNYLINVPAGYLYNCEDKDFTRVDIDDGCTFIGDDAFAGCTNLKIVNLPQSLKLIDVWAFAETAIESIKIPKSVTSIGDDAFSDCKNLKRVELPEMFKPVDEKSANNLVKIFSGHPERYNIEFTWI